jgi:hypothetical protein
MAGAPSKYLPKYCAGIVAHMATGASATSYAAEIDVSRSTISEWASVHPEFSIALSRGKAKAGAWWEKQGRSICETGKGSAVMALFGMRNMGGDDWTDKPDDKDQGDKNNTVGWL